MEVIRILIVEDENAAAKNLVAILKETDLNIEITSVLESVSETVAYFQSDHNTDLAFFDIQLSDDIVFKVFDKCKVDCPVIFTTAFNQYAVRAFKVNSIDYILKPVNKKAITFALEKYKELRSSGMTLNQEKVMKLLKELSLKNRDTYRHSFLVQKKDRLIPVDIVNFSFFVIENGIVSGMTVDKKKYVLDYTLESLEEQLDPSVFFRANRQIIVNRSAIMDLNLYFNGKLVLNIKPSPDEKIIVSKQRAPELKKWLGR